MQKELFAIENFDCCEKLDYIVFLTCQCYSIHFSYTLVQVQQM